MPDPGASRDPAGDASRRYTLAAPATHQEEIRKSRFEVFAGPARTVAEAMDFLARHAVPAATHNCWAYRVGLEYRFNDDGEPGGTAGRPILQAIEGQCYDHVAVLVARWFGGIKLGAGGLVRAYGGSAAQCLRLAERVERVDEVTLECWCPFPQVAALRARLDRFQARIQAEAFDEGGACWRVALPRARWSPWVDEFMNLTRGQGRCAPAPGQD